MALTASLCKMSIACSLKCII
uniref:Uncharacterized protein n=1 Tax=Anguilla anguilla TaxID=7936 RepID=A0A0E9R203_ANGAN